MSNLPSSRAELEERALSVDALREFLDAFRADPCVEFNRRHDLLTIRVGSPQPGASFDLPHGTVVRANRYGEIIGFEIYAFEKLFLEEFPVLRRDWAAYRRSQSWLWPRIGFLGNARQFLIDLLDRLSEIFTQPHQRPLPIA